MLIEVLTREMRIRVREALPYQILSDLENSLRDVDEAHELISSDGNSQLVDNSSIKELRLLTNEVATSRSFVRELVLASSGGVIVIAKILTSFKNLLLHL